MKAAPPITTTEVAHRLDDLLSTRFRIVAVRKSVSMARDAWRYTMLPVETSVLRGMRDAGKAIMVTGRSDGQVVLFAKLVASRG